MVIVRVENLVRYYGRLRALDEVSFSMKKGEIIGVLGLNGAGKTTCLRVLAGLLKPTAGKAEVAGKDVLDDSIGVRSMVGFLPEEPPLYVDMTVDAYLRHTGLLKGLTGEQIDSRIPEVCERTGIDSVTRKRIIDELSHGYRKRVGIAGAILHRPPLVILDEPISGLDPAQIVEMRKTVRDLREDHSVMVSSHILTEISQTCDRILVFHEGRLVAEGTEEELTGRPGRQVEITVRGTRRELTGFMLERPEVIEHGIRKEEAGLVTTLVKLASQVGDSGDGQEDALEVLIAALVEKGFGIRRVTPAESELESVFLGLTRNAGPRPDAPAAPADKSERIEEVA